MAEVSEFRRRKQPELGSLNRVVDFETVRLCAIVDAARDLQVREEALAELKLLASNVRLCIEAMDYGDSSSATRLVSAA